MLMYKVILFLILLQLREIETQKAVPFTKCRNQVDLIFLLDGSQSVTQSNFDLVKKYTINFISEFEVNLNDTRVGIIEFGTFIGTSIGLQRYESLENLTQAINNIQMSNYGTSTHKAVKQMRTLFKMSPRPGARKVAVCITDGLSVSPNFTKYESEAAHNEGVIMFALGIGKHVFKTELMFIASKTEYVKEVPDYNDLPTDLALEICHLKPQTTTFATKTSSDLSIDRIDDKQKIGITAFPITKPSIINEGSVDVNRQFLPHPMECDMFLETENIDGVKRVHERHCPFGQFYNENDLTCVQPKHSTCKYDICNGKLTAPMSDNCRGYWVCVSGEIHGVCCPAGTRFVYGSGCQTGECGISCPFKSENSRKTECNLKADPNNYGGYIEYVSGYGDIKRECAPGTAFIQVSCGCTIIIVGSGNNVSAITTTATPSCTTNLYLPFNKSPSDTRGLIDKSRMSTPMSCSNINVTDEMDGKALFGLQDCFIYIWRFASIELRNLIIQFQVIPVDKTTNDGYQSVISNCYPSSTCEPSFAVLVDQQTGTMGIKLLVNSPDNNQTTINEWMSYKSNQKNDISIEFGENKVLFTVNQRRTVINVQGTIYKRQSGFAIGRGGPYGSFNGYLDELKIISC